MGLNKKFIDLFHKVSVQAALASHHFVGKKDKIAADKAAVDTMRKELNNIDMKGQIVIGEGELDKAPMLYIGEKLGTNNGPELDIAVDPSKRQEMQEKTNGARTIPQIFIGDTYVGGYNELKALEVEGKLNSLLGI